MTIPPPLAWLLAVALAMLFAWLERGTTRRLAAAALPLLLTAMALPPHRPGRAATAATLPDSAGRATVESVAVSVAPGGTITVTGHGIHPEYWPLLAGRRVAWSDPERSSGLVALAWPRRALVGQPLVIHGAVGGGDSQVVHLVGPAGERDSVRSDSTFTFQVIPRASGLWHWALAVGGGDPDTLSIDVREPPRLVVAIIAAQPDFALPALARRLEAQGASVTLRTRLTATLWRTEHFGPDAPVEPLGDEALATLDLLVLGDGAERLLAASERRQVRAAVADGLGLLQFLGSARATSELLPFRIRSVGEVAERVTAIVNGVPARTTIAASPIRLAEGTAVVTDSGGVALASVVEVGRGRIAATRILAPSQWTLAGEPDVEARWWAALGGATLRAPAGRWEVSDSALLRLDEPVRIRWLGDTAGATVLREGTTTDTLTWAATDSLGGEVRLWPREAGWLTLVREADSLRLWVAGAEAFAGVERGMRQRAAAAALDGAVAAGPPAAPRSVPLPRWPFGLALLGAAAVVWRRGTDSPLVELGNRT